MAEKNNKTAEDNGQQVVQLMQESKRNIMIYQGQITLLRNKYNALGYAEEQLTAYQTEMEIHRSKLVDVSVLPDASWEGKNREDYDAAVYDEVYSVTYPVYIRNIQELVSAIQTRMAELENSIAAYEEDIRTESRKVLQACMW